MARQAAAVARTLARRARAAGENPTLAPCSRPAGAGTTVEERALFSRCAEKEYTERYTTLKLLPAETALEGEHEGGVELPRTTECSPKDHNARGSEEGSQDSSGRRADVRAGVLTRWRAWDGKRQTAIDTRMLVSKRRESVSETAQAYAKRSDLWAPSKKSRKKR